MTLMATTIAAVGLLACATGTSSTAASRSDSTSRTQAAPAAAHRPTSAGQSAASTNAVAVENARPGDNHWLAYLQAAPPAAIAGYSSQVSIRPGEPLDLHVSSSQRYRVEVDRLGWYGGAGGRRLACLPSCSGDEAGRAFTNSPPDSSTGFLDAGWPVTDRVLSTADWTTGYYLAVFVLSSGPDAGKTSFYPFVVTPPAGTPTSILVQVPVNTWQAYNPWPGADRGGTSLYGSNSAGAQAAVKVSFNRPLLPPYQKPVFGREYQGVRWLERQGYSVGYYADSDVDQNPAELLNHKVDMVLGHDEYWTMAMRKGWDAARAAGHNLIFMGADIGSWQVRYEDNGRTLVGYKNTAPDPQPDPELRTITFRKLPTPMPECSLEGVQYDDHATHPGRSNYLVTSAGATNPWVRASGLRNGDILKYAVAYEWDKITPGCQTPPLTDVFHYSPVAGASPADAVLLRDPSGAQVFAAGSNQLTLLLDNYGAPSDQPADPRLGAFMAAMLRDLTGSAPVPPPPVTKLRLPRGPLRLARTGCISVRLSASAASTVRGTLTITRLGRGRGLRLARVGFRIAPGRSTVVCARVSRTTRRLLKGRRRVRVAVTVTYGVGGIHTTRRVDMVLTG